MAPKPCIGVLGALLFVSATATTTAQDDLTPPPAPPADRQQPDPSTGGATPPRATIPAPPPGYGGQPSPYVQAQPQVPIRPEPPADPTPRRSGFTFEAGLGVSLMQSDETEGDVGFGIAPLSLGVGFFLTRDFALSVRATGASFFYDYDTLGVFILQHYGANLQFFIDDRFMVAAGPGLSVVGALDGGELDLGFGVNARAGYALLSSSRINIRVLLELLMGAGHNEGTIFGQCLKVEFQLL